MGLSSRALVADLPARACRRGPAGAGLPSRAGPTVAIVVRSVLGRTACRGRQLHHDHHGGCGGCAGGRLIATIAANERYRGPAACCRLKGPPRRTDAFAMVTPLTTAPPAAAPAASPSGVPTPWTRRPCASCDCSP